MGGDVACACACACAAVALLLALTGSLARVPLRSAALIVTERPRGTVLALRADPPRPYGSAGWLYGSTSRCDARAVSCSDCIEPYFWE